LRSLALAVLVLVGVLIALPVGLLGRIGRGGRIVRWWLRGVAFVLGLRIHVRGRVPGGPALWCANHVSWLDVLVLGGLADVCFVSKAEVRRWPLVGWCAAAAGTLFLARGAGTASAMLDTVAHRLTHGRSTAVFPEGTTSTGRSVGRFHHRLFGAAIKAERPVQPVALRYLEAGAASRRAPFVGEDSLVPHLVDVLAGGTIEVEVTLLPLVSSRGHDRRSLARAAQASVASLIDSTPAAADVEDILPAEA